LGPCPQGIRCVSAHVQADQRERNRYAQRRAAASSRLQLLQYGRTSLMLLCLAVIIYVASYGRRLQTLDDPSPVTIGPDEREIHSSPGYNYSTTHSSLGVFVLVDLATLQPNTTNTLPNCTEVVIQTARRASSNGVLCFAYVFFLLYFFMVDFLDM